MLEGGVCCAQTPTAVEKTSNSSERGRMRFGCDNPDCGRCQSNRSHTMNSSPLAFVSPLDLLEPLVRGSDSFATATQSHWLNEYSFASGQ